MDESLKVPDMNIEMEIYASTNTGEPKRMYKPVLLDKITWTNTWDCNPSKMEFTTLKDAVINYGFGSKVVLKVNKDIVWVGYVFDKQRNADVKIKNTAYDQIRYLRNRIAKSFEGKKTSEIVKSIADEFYLPMEKIQGLKNDAKLPDMLIDNEEACEALNNVLTHHLVYNKENLSFHDEKGKLVLKTIEDMRITDQVFYPGEMGDYDYTSSISETYNSIVIDVLAYDGETHDRYVEFKDDESIKRWGLLRFMDQSNEQMSLIENKCRNLLSVLNRENRTLKLKKVKGNLKVYPGSLVVVNLPLGDFVLNNWMVVKEVTHTIDDTGYWMDLIVENSDLGFSEPLSPEGQFQVEKHTTTDDIGEAGDLEGETVPATMYNFFRSQGLSAAAACGAIGNAEAESTFDPSAQNRLPGGGSDGGYGLFQWTNTKWSARRDKLFSWCRSNNKDVTQVMPQLEYAMYEISSGQTYIELNDYKRITDVTTATAEWLSKFEVFNPPQAEVQWPRRLASAKKYYNMWKDYERVPTEIKVTKPSTSKPSAGGGKVTGSMCWPIKGGYGWISSPVGWRNLGYGLEYHLGVDIAVANGYTVVAVDGGTVLAAGDSVEDGSYGVSVLIKHGTLYTRYAHLGRGTLRVRKGDAVSKGQVIGLSNSTGNITGPHLHFEVRTGPDMTARTVLDPEKYIKR